MWLSPIMAQWHVSLWVIYAKICVKNYRIYAVYGETLRAKCFYRFWPQFYELAIFKFDIGNDIGNDIDTDMKLGFVCPDWLKLVTWRVLLTNKNVYLDHMIYSSV